MSDDILVKVPRGMAAVASAFEALLATVRAQTDRGATLGPSEYDSFEAELAERAGAIERAAHGVTLAALDIDSPGLLIDGRSYRRVLRSEASYRTLAGEVPVMRTLYRESGNPDKRAVDMVSLRAGVVEDGWLPATARAMAFLLQQGTSREAETAAKQLGRLPYSRSSFERVGHAVGHRYVGQRTTIERTLIEDEEIPEQARSISASLDRVSVPMEEPRERPVGRPRRGDAKRPISRVYRMAYVATVSLHDCKGETLRTIRYGTMPGGDAERLCLGVADDVLMLLAKQPRLKLALLCDGAPEMWNLLDAEFDAESFGRKPIRRLIDFWHTIEKLGKAARAIHGDGAPQVIARWRIGLLNRSAARDVILRELRESGCEDVQVGESRPVHEAITYLDNAAGRMDYARARKLGLPIGSGNVEATCKSLVDVRMKRAGSRWKIDTGEHVIQLRALALSDRWDRAMDLALAPPRARIRRAA